MATSIITFNINGIRAAHKKGFMDWFKKEQPDVLFLQEIKAKEEQVPEEIREAEGYHTFWNPAERPGYSGTGLMTKKKPNKVSFGFGVEKFDCEGRVIQADYDDFTVFGVYFPNGSMGNKRVPYKLEFYDEFMKYIKKLQKKGHKVIITGDYNTAHTEIDLKNPKANEKNTGFLPEERVWLDKYLAEGFKDVFRDQNPGKEGCYTYWSMRTNARPRNAGWRLDFYYVADDFVDKVGKCTIMSDVMGSDHCPVKLIVK